MMSPAAVRVGPLLCWGPFLSEGTLLSAIQRNIPNLTLLPGRHQFQGTVVFAILRYFASLKAGKLYLPKSKLT